MEDAADSLYRIPTDSLHYATQDNMADAPPSAKNALKRLVDVGNLYQILGDTLIQFMKEKPQSYGMNATK